MNQRLPAAILERLHVETLNSECFCLSLDQAALDRAIEAEVGEPGLAAMVRERCPHLFAARPVFVSASQARRMAEAVAAIESVVALPAWQEDVLARAPDAARHPSGARGVFFGHDFHAAGDNVGLIEINTNAGGALLNAVVARAHRACCPEIEELVPPPTAADRLEEAIVAMFREEWRLFSAAVPGGAGAARPLASIAIVDDAPETQYLYPEFLMFRRLFEHHGLAAVIADPAQLQVRAGRLFHGETPIDLVYNRVTDFPLGEPAHAALRQAWMEDLACVTPHPRAHALFADKRNLVTLSDAERLRELGVPHATVEILLRDIPRTERVAAAGAERLWRERKGLFFKPAAGFGSRAAYRGDKITQRVWQEIQAGDYVAQALVPPGERVISDNAQGRPLKFDLRNYVYAGAVQWVGARLYQGQTTNFRTPEGGFAPVYRIPDPGGLRS